jgi:hypothetical protein
VLTLQRNGRLRLERRARFSQRNDVRVTWISNANHIFTELLRWQISVEKIVALPGLQGLADFAP